MKPVQTTSSFDEVIHLIEKARQQAFQAVNTTLIDLYWQVGEYISRKLETSEWGDGVIDELARHIGRTQPGIRGFTRRNLFRMRQFYETYPEKTIVTAVLTQMPWTHHLIIMGQSKRLEEREFYLHLAIRERWSTRELERQFRACLFERTVLGPPKVSPVVTQIHAEALNIFKDSYVVEFLNLPDGQPPEPPPRRKRGGK
jgi:predicted nuclease of restriction endonuclease-like (RecB) superfamily